MTKLEFHFTDFDQTKTTIEHHVINHDSSFYLDEKQVINSAERCGVDLTKSNWMVKIITPKR